MPNPCNRACPSTGGAFDRLGRVSYFPDFIHKWGEKPFKQLGVGMAVGSAASMAVLGPASVAPWALAGITGAYWAVGLNDMRQVHHGKPCARA